jgi:hypothetical protein
MKIEFINYPYVYTDNGMRIDIDAINGNPKVGAELVENEFELGGVNGYYNVLVITSETECVNGVCPVK